MVKMRDKKGIFLATRVFAHHGKTNFSSSVAAAQEARPYEEMPGPKPIPILGNKFRFLPGFRKYNFDDLIELHTQLNKEYGSIVKFSGVKPRNDFVFVYDPKDVETVYRNDGLWPNRPTLTSLEYYRKHTRKDFFKGVGGLIVEIFFANFNKSQGKEWAEARHHTNPILMQTKIVEMYAPKIDQVADDFVSKIPGWMDSKNEMPDDFKNELHKWALESIAVVALDTRLGCLGEKLDPESEPQKMIEAVHTMFSALHNLEIGGEAFLWRIYPSPSWRKLVKVMNYFVDVSYKYVQQATEKSKNRKEGVEPSALEKLLQRDPNPVRAVIMALDMLMAGIDTTSHSVTNLVLLLSENQGKQEKLRDELKRVMPNANAPITMDMLNEMKYLKACIKESMRLHPVVTGNLRTTQTELVLSNYKVPAGVDVIMGNAVMSRFGQHYKNAGDFIPERWLRGGELEEKANPFVTLPFGHGARKCIGMRFALLEMEMAVAKMIRRFRWEFKYGPMKYKTSMVHAPASPLKFTVHSL